MTRATVLGLAVWALIFLVGGVVFGLIPKQIHIADCGTLFNPAEPANLTSEAASECGQVFAGRYPFLWGLFICGGTLGLAAVVAGVFVSMPSHKQTA